MKDKVSIELIKEEAELVYILLMAKLVDLDKLQVVENEKKDSRRVKEIKIGKDLIQNTMDKLLRG